jgi:uncharacterized protein YjiS (DUF1127 family)
MYRYNTSEKSGSNFIASSRGGTQAGFVTRLSDTLLTWLDRVRQRRHLAELDDRMLRDIGLSRGEVENEVSRRFWQAYE